MKRYLLDYFDLKKALYEWKKEDIDFLKSCADEGYFPYFRFIDWVLKNKVKNDRDVFLLRHNFSAWNNEKHYTLRETGRHFDVSAERVRQFLYVLKSCLKITVAASIRIINNPFVFTQYFNNEVWKHGFVSEEFANEVNRREGTDLHPEALLFILQAMSRNTTDLFNISYRENYYSCLVSYEALINNDLKFFIKTLTRSKTRFCFRQTIKELQSNGYEISPYTIDALGKLTELVYWSKNSSVIPQADMAYEVLKKYGKPLTTEYIREEIKKLYPQYTHYPLATLRKRALSDERFIQLGQRNNLLALKEWEHTIPGIMGGSFGTIALAYLEQKNEACSLIELTEYMLQYRETNLRSVKETLMADTKKRFCFPKKNMVALSKWY